MKNSDAQEHMAACNTFAQASPDNLARTLRFVLATIQQHLETVPAILADFEEVGAGSVLAFGSKRDGLEFIVRNKSILFEAAHLCKTEPASLLELFLTVPGLGLVKAGFAAQLFASRVGCLDTHNISLYGIPANSLRFDKKLSPTTQRKKVVAYVGLCESLGGAVELWARWCDYKATLTPDNWERAGFSVSLFHAECLTDKYTHNVLAFMNIDRTATFEREYG